MYDDDEIMGTHTMPWFDPRYLATPDTQPDEEVSDSLVPRCFKPGVANSLLATYTASCK